MSEDKKPFTVKDRRQFTTEGDARPVEDEGAAPATTAAAPAPAAPDDDAESPEEPGEPIPADLSGLVISLAAQAGVLLGAGKPDATEGARGLISLLEMLQVKTRGNRTPEEEQLLADVLFQLRMAFVQRTRGET